MFSMTPVPGALRCLALIASASIALWASGTVASPLSVVAFCKVHPDLDFPNRVFYGPSRQGGVPREVATVGATRWRCMDGRVFVCNRGASGSACLKMEASRAPSREIREACEDNPDQSFVATAVIANSSSTWRCEGQVPMIIRTVPLDARGFMKGTWFPLLDAGGALDTKIEFGADPR